MLTLAIGLMLAVDGGVSETQRLFVEASAAKKEKKYERAVELMERCIELEPKNAQCLRLLGSIWASIATRDQSSVAMEKARRYYERLLEEEPIEPAPPPMGDFGGLLLPTREFR